MLKTVFIIKDKASAHSQSVAAEMIRAVEALGRAGFRSAVLEADSAEEAEAAEKSEAAGKLEAAGKSDAAGKSEAAGKSRAAEKSKAAGKSDAAEKAEASEKIKTAERAEAAEAVKPEKEAPYSGNETLFLCECGSVLRGLLEKGRFAIGYAHADNPAERFPGAPYIVQEPDLVDADSYIKMYQRAAGIPWTILETERCVVREFTAEDLDAIAALYDAQARRFLEAPSDNRAREREILQAYIERIYGLYGFGQWAVIPKGQPQTLIGRVGYSAVTSRQEQEAKLLGISCPDADFGFLIDAKWRRMGIAEEVCRALLQYGFSELGFTRIRADARNDNMDSVRLLSKLGFVPVGSGISDRHTGTADKTVYLRVSETNDMK